MVKINSISIKTIEESELFDRFKEYAEHNLPYGVVSKEELEKMDKNDIDKCDVFQYKSVNSYRDRFYNFYVKNGDYVLFSPKVENAVNCAVEDCLLHMNKNNLDTYIRAIKSFNSSKFFRMSNADIARILERYKTITGKKCRFKLI